MAQSYKARKEAFVSNLSGGDVSEINIVTLVVPVSANTPLKHSQMQVVSRNSSFYAPF